MWGGAARGAGRMGGRPALCSGFATHCTPLTGGNSADTGAVFAAASLRTTLQPRFHILDLCRSGSAHGAETSVLRPGSLQNSQQQFFGAMSDEKKPEVKGEPISIKINDQVRAREIACAPWPALKLCESFEGEGVA